LDTNSISLFGLASRRMDWLAARQQVISENVANADTPGFRAKEVSPFSEMLDRSRVPGLALTHEGHIRGRIASQVGVREDDATWDQTLDGNTVVLEQQTVKANEVFEAHRLASEIYRKGHNLLGMAATGR
jgi:flagellar basal-body rod protein FlgB